MRPGPRTIQALMVLAALSLLAALLPLLVWPLLAAAVAVFAMMAAERRMLGAVTVTHDEAPVFVLPLDEAGPGRARRFAVAGLRDGWAWAPRRWTKVTDDTGVGNPNAATPEKGARYFDAVTERLAGFYTELAAADPEHLYA